MDEDTLANPFPAEVEGECDDGGDDLMDLPTSLTDRPIPTKKTSSLSVDFKMEKMDVVLSYWKQKQTQRDTVKKKSMSREAIMKYIDEVLHVSI